ncbi:MAG: hypothetical protein QOI84_1996 [Solirubrobacterales bacterium]|jgi:hypothetical protein|nr:hypothetical protein [Solirubrobacterales bacterium]
MFKHGKKILLGAGVLAALSFGGSALSAAGAAPVTPVVQHSSSADTDQIQSGDQSTPDVGAEAPGTETADAAQASKDAETMDGAQGTQDTETQDGPNGESGSEAPSNDGPGGHADEPANPNANHQAGGATQE